MEGTGGGPGRWTPIILSAAMGNYCEGTLRGSILYQINPALHARRNIEQTEVESIPFTRYSKGAAFAFQMQYLSLMEAGE